MARKKVTAPAITRRKGSEKIAMVTAYDFITATMAEKANVDMILVGDSLGMVVQGGRDSLQVSLEDMVYHTQCVQRSGTNALVVTDMPFGSFQVSVTETVENALRLVREAKAEAVKVEGAEPITLEAVSRLASIGIPVVAHIGLTPQSMLTMGGFRVQGKTEDAATRIRNEAAALQDAGAFCLVLEGVPAPLAKQITAQLEIPTIGIGAGISCDGQVLVCTDLLGLTPNLTPRFVKRYREHFDDGVAAFREYVNEVKEGAFPTDEHSYGLASRPKKDTLADTHSTSSYGPNDA